MGLIGKERVRRAVVVGEGNAEPGCYGSCLGAAVGCAVVEEDLWKRGRGAVDENGVLVSLAGAGAEEVIRFGHCASRSGDVMKKEGVDDWLCFCCG